MKQRWAIVGMGFIYPRHKAAIEEVGDEIVMTCDIDPTKGATYTSFDDMVGQFDFHSKVDCVAICTPNDTHIPMIRKCIALNKKVLCEKPIGINSTEIYSLPDSGSVFSVLQLRKKLPDLKEKAKKATKARIHINVHRNESYWNGWKGDVSRSGGLLMNLGVHYFDMLIQLFGNDYQVKGKALIERDNNRGWAHGSILFHRPQGDIEVAYVVSLDNGAECKRDIVIDDEIIGLSDKENLSYEDLHKEVYKDFKKGIGVLPSDAGRAIRLIEKLK